MALRHNCPANGNIFVENLVLSYDDKSYAINNIYTSKQYLYWNENSPTELVESDIRITNEGYHLIFKNVNGNGIKMYNSLIKLVFDNFDPEGLVENVKNIKSETEEYNAKLNSTNENVESLSSQYRQTRDFNDIKESLNTSTVNLTSMLISLNNTLNVYLNDNKFTQYEKSDVNAQLDNINNKCIETLAYADALADIYTEYTVPDNLSTTLILQYKVSLEGYLTTLLTELGKVIENSDENVGNQDIIPITTCVTNMITTLSELKNSCSGLIFLGSGGTISDEVYVAHSRIDSLLNNFSELQTSILGGLNDEDKIIQNYLNEMKITSNKIVAIIDDCWRNNKNLTQTQYSNIHTYVLGMNNLVSSLNSLYNTYYNNSKLESKLKTQLKNDHDKFISKYNNFKKVISDKFSDLNVSKSDMSTWRLALADYRDTRTTLCSTMITCVGSIKNAAYESTITQLRTEFNNKINNLQKQIDELKKGN